MSTDIAESLPKRKFAAAPMVAKGAKGKEKSAPPAAKGGGGKGASEEGSEKKIRQAVYDIIYRARREDIDLKAAFAQYMSNSSLGQAERTAVREKLFGKTGGMSEKYVNGADELALEGVASALYKVFVEKEEKEIELAYLQQLDEEEVGKKYKVRVTDKNGRSYVRFADRAKITELRQNSNIESVEMTDHGEPYEGERRKGKMTAKAKSGKLDPVGKEDADVDNDGDVDKSDKYILNRRRKIGKAIRTRAEAYLADGTISTEPGLGSKKVTGKDPITGGPVDNYSGKEPAVVVSPDDGSKPVRKVGVYAHLELKGGALSEAQIKMMKMVDDKKKKEEKKKGMEAMDGMTKTSIKDMKTKPDGCEPEEEEKPDLRSKYAMINLIKNKLRAAGQRDPMVMMNDPVMGEDYRSRGGPMPTKPKGSSYNLEYKKEFEKRNPGVPFPYKLEKKPSPFKSGVEKKEMDPKKGTAKKKTQPAMKTEDVKATPMTTVTGDGSKLSPKHLPGGPNSQYDIDGVPKKKKKPTGPSKPSGEIKKDTAPKTRKPKYNPYGPGTANPENMAPGKP